MPDPQTPPAPDFSAIQGHQIHDPSTISAAKPDTMGLGIQDIDPARLATDIGPALDHLTSHIENYTQSGRALHPVLSRLGDATRAAKELLVGGTTPKGPQEGVLNNPVTTTMSMAVPAPEAAEALADRRAFAANPEAGHIKLDFDSIPGHQVHETAPQGGHAGGGVASVEELNRPGRFVKVSRSGQLTDQGKVPDFNLQPGEAGYQVTPEGYDLKAGQETPATKLGVDKYHKEVFRPKAASVRPTPKQAIEDAGMVYKGELMPGSHVHMLEHPDYPGKTAAMKEAENITPETVKEKMANKLKEFGIKHNPAGAGSMVSKALSQ